MNLLTDAFVPRKGSKASRMMGMDFAMHRVHCAYAEEGREKSSHEIVSSLHPNNSCIIGIRKFVWNLLGQKQS
jgi:hypothetical protein